MIISALLAGVGLLIVMPLLRWSLQAIVAWRRRLHGPNRINEMSAWSLGGIRQVVQLRGNDTANPLLIYLHGGPGLPVMPFAHAVQSAWEARFTVVQWDQRNTGKTLVLNGPQYGLSLGSYVADGLELAQALRERFPGRPIALLGHSWGTAIAVEMLRKEPGLFAGYFAIGQVSDFLKAERYGYETVLAEAKRQGARKLMEALSKYPNYPTQGSLSEGSITAVRTAEMKLGFAHHSNKRIMLKMFGLAFVSPDYSWRDLLSLANRKAQALSLEVALHDLPRFIDHAAEPEIQCPVIMVGGKFDLFTPTPMARAFFETIKAPHKEFIEVANMAHFGPIEDADLIAEIILTKLHRLVEDDLSIATASASNSL